MEVVRALDSRCQVRQVALGHGRMPPPLYIGAISMAARLPALYISAISSDMPPPLYIGAISPLICPFSILVPYLCPLSTLVPYLCPLSILMPYLVINPPLYIDTSLLVLIGAASSPVSILVLYLLICLSIFCSNVVPIF